MYTLPFFFGMNKDHGTDCKWGKLCVCLWLCYTYSIYHLQTIPQWNDIKLLGKRKDLMTICFHFITFRCSIIFNLLYLLRFISCTAAIAFPPLSISFLLFFLALMFFNCIIWFDDAITIRRKPVCASRIIHLFCKHSGLDKI